MAVPHLCHSSRRLSTASPRTIESIRPLKLLEPNRQLVADRPVLDPVRPIDHRSGNSLQPEFQKRAVMDFEQPVGDVNSPAAAPTDGRSGVPGRAAVISACLNEYRCGAATQRYRSALPELRLRSLHRSSAFRGDRQRGPMRYPDVRPNSSIRQNTDLSP